MRARLAKTPGLARGAAAGALRVLAQDLADTVRSSLQNPESATPHGRSAPGDAPADPTGNLAAAVAVETDADESKTGVSVALPYARWLEFGTARMAARPFLRPAAADAAKGAASLVRNAVRAALIGGRNQP